MSMHALITLICISCFGGFIKLQYVMSWILCTAFTVFEVACIHILSEVPYRVGFDFVTRW